MMMKTPLPWGWQRIQNVGYTSLSHRPLGGPLNSISRENSSLRNCPQTDGPGWHQRHTKGLLRAGKTRAPCISNWPECTGLHQCLHLPHAWISRRQERHLETADEFWVVNTYRGREITVINNRTQCFKDQWGALSSEQEMTSPSEPMFTHILSSHWLDVSQNTPHKQQLLNTIVYKLSTVNSHYFW